jgi:hypothetical protein
MKCHCGKTISKVTVSLYGEMCRRCYIEKLDKMDAEETEHGIAFHRLPDVEDQFQPKHMSYGLKRRDCCHANDAGTETRESKQLFYNMERGKFYSKPSTYKEVFMTCPFDSMAPDRKVFAWSNCPGNHGKEGVRCQKFRRKL